MPKAFTNFNRAKPRPPQVSDVALRDFSGGLKVTDNEVALKNKYATVLTNMFRDEDRSQVLRFGTKEFATCSGNILRKTYFRDHLIVFLENGEIQKVTNDGVVTTIWNTAIAAALPGAPSAWSTGLTLVDFTQFRGELIATNGIDKPILIAKTLTVSYLQDIPTGSNVNTPITRFVTTAANYCVMAGITDSSVVYISAKGASGTWPNDPAPNDAISFDVGAYTGRKSSDIKNISTFKNMLLVFFDNFTALIQLGTYDSSGNHSPEVIDTYDKLGIVNYKMTVSSDRDLVFASRVGVHSAERTVFSGTLSTDFLSDDLGTLYNKTAALTDTDDLTSFMVDDKLSKTVFIVFHKADATVQAFAMRYSDKYNKNSWSEISGWSFTDACISEKHRVFFSEGTKIYQYGNSVFTDENFYADYTTDGIDGNNIEFDWEFPWLDAGNRIKTKKLVKITFDTTGTSDFSLQCFVDKIYKDVNDVLDPALEMAFEAGDTSGYGVDAGGYGGGRRANDERFFGFPLYFKILKMRIYGSTKEPLRISTISLLFQKGSYHR